MSNSYLRSKNYKTISELRPDSSTRQMFLWKACKGDLELYKRWLKGIFSKDFSERKQLTETWLSLYSPDTEIVEIDPLDREKWISARKNWCGASDVPKLMGALEQYASPRSVFYEKTGRAEKNNFRWGEEYPSFEGEVPSIAAHFGLAFENSVADYTKEALEFWSFQPHCQFRGGKNLVVTPDRLIIGAPLVLQIKTQNPRNTEKWGTDIYDIPLDYFYQEQAELAGFSENVKAILVGFFWGETFKYRICERQDEAIHKILSEVDTFWTENVLKDVDPPRMYECDTFTGKQKEGLPVLKPSGSELERLKSDIEELENLKGAKSISDKRIKEIENSIKNLFEKFSEIDLGDKIISYKRFRAANPSIDFQEWEKLALEEQLPYLEPNVRQIKKENIDLYKRLNGTFEDIYAISIKKKS